MSLFTVSCSNPSGGGEEGGGSPSSAKAITGFTVAGVPGEINAGTKTVTVTVPLDTAATLTPAITIEGASVSPASGVSKNFAVLVPYTVTAADGSTAQWIVTVKWEPLEAGADIGNYLDGYIIAHPGTGTAENPVPLPVSMDLSGGGWAALLTAIQSKGKYVALDLSACDISGTEFDPGTANTGEKYIVSLILPDAATSIKAGAYSDPTFENFTGLKSVSGGAVTGVGDCAFYGCTALTTVSLPAATTIGDQAFQDCSDLATVGLPAAITIGYQAFQDCSDLATVSLPAATTIGDYAFFGCTDLETVSLPVVTTIGNGAFSGCTVLATVSLPAATSIGQNAFFGCTALATVSLPAATTIGGYAFYGCTALATVSLPVATTIGYYAFGSTNGKALAVTLGPTAPTLGYTIFTSVTVAKSVTVTVPAGALGYAALLPATYSGGEKSGGPHWGEGFRGRGWTSGGAYGSYGTVNASIDLTIKVQEETP